jgi:hypothetical protein
MSIPQSIVGQVIETAAKAMLEVSKTEWRISLDFIL